MDIHSNITSNPSQMLQELTYSKEHGNVIGIWAGELGEGLHMCGVENIIEDRSGKIIELKKTDLNGVSLKVWRLQLIDIHIVFLFRILFTS